MRSLARLLMELQKVSGEKSSNLTAFISPTKFDLVIAATRNLCSHNVEADNDHLSAFDRPSLALHVPRVNVKIRQGFCSILLGNSFPPIGTKSERGSLIKSQKLTVPSHTLQKSPFELRNLIFHLFPNISSSW